MTVIPPDGYCSVDIIFDSSVFNSGIAYVTQMWKVDEGVPGEFVNAFGVAMETNLSPLFFQDCYPTRARFGFHDHLEEVSGYNDGENGGAHALPSTCVLTKYNALGRGRQYQGRNYWPGLLQDEEVADNGLLNGTKQENLQAAFTAFYTEMGSLDFHPVIYHRNSDLDPSRIVSMTVEPKVATQRRRLR